MSDRAEVMTICNQAEHSHNVQAAYMLATCSQKEHFGRHLSRQESVLAGACCILGRLVTDKCAAALSVNIQLWPGMCALCCM